MKVRTDELASGLVFSSPSGAIFISPEGCGELMLTDVDLVEVVVDFLLYFLEPSDLFVTLRFVPVPIRKLSFFLNIMIF